MSIQRTLRMLGLLVSILHTPTAAREMPGAIHPAPDHPPAVEDRSTLDQDSR